MPIKSAQSQDSIFRQLCEVIPLHLWTDFAPEHVEGPAPSRVHVACVGAGVKSGGIGTLKETMCKTMKAEAIFQSVRAVFTGLTSYQK